MDLSLQMFLIICPLLFLAGFVDSIAGGGGLISLPAFIFAGLPIHYAIGTNKLSAACGTMLATARFAKNKLINFRLVIPGIIVAIIGSAIGSNLSLIASEELIQKILFVVLPLAAFVVLNKHLFPDSGSEEAVATPRTIAVCAISSFVIGIYDGFYGPGTGSFLIIAFTVFAKLSVGSANAQAKAINLTTNITSLVVFLINGQVIILLGLVGAACNMLGNYIGSGLVMTKGTKIVRPIIITVLVLLLIKILNQ